MRQLPALTVPALVFGFPTAGQAASDSDRFYQVVFVYVKDATKYGEYVQHLGPVVSRYGVRADRIRKTQSTAL